jgi:hypothetical protein
MRREDRKTKMGDDRYLLMDAGELTLAFSKYRAGMSFGSWNGDSESDFAKKVATGDVGLVEEADDFLTKLEDQVPMSRGFRNVDDVVGALPNVPAFLAGHPQCMRRRVKVAKDNAPLTIYMDLTSSGGINASDVERRGVALLALSRTLIEHRPVELWIGSSLGKNFVSGTVAWRIDTVPLDLARAAYHISGTAMSRSFGYGIAKSVLGTGGAWPFNNYSLHCDTAEQRLRNVMGFGELLYVPPIYLGDKLTKDPVGWIKKQLVRYVGEEQ